MTDTAFHILPIRHHGPGSARSLLRALDRLTPDCILLEGPPDAQDILHFAVHEQMAAPVSILVYAADDPGSAVYYPFARFSPEWNAIRWGLQKQVPVRFFDLPQQHRMAIDREKAAALAAAVPSAEAESEPEIPASAPAAADAEPTVEAPATLLRRDPLGELARIAGFDDGERWWEHVIEHRRAVENDPDADLSLFAAIREAMLALRENESAGSDSGDRLREAYMRRCMREAAKEGFKAIVVVCGAFHAPALADPTGQKKQDDLLLKGLPRIKTTATWVPWTHELLTSASGYGAGVRSPGWYEHLFSSDTLVLERWMTRTARLLREEDVDCSSAHVIEAVRLAHSLATMRQRPLPDLTDISDASRSVFCHDSDAPMRLIARRLLIGEALGQVPEDAPQVPLQQDLSRLQKSLRLKPEALEKTIELDLRNENDLARSHLLHRLKLLGIDWGVPREAGGKTKGTFKEAWQLRWDPHFAVKLIQSARFGNTVQEAAGGIVRHRLGEQSTDLPALAALVDTLLLAELPEALDALLRQINAVAAVAGDVAALMDALPPLVRAMRYGTVRRTDTALLTGSVQGILPRIIAGLPPAVGNLNDDLAADFVLRIQKVHEAIALLGDESTDAAAWLSMLAHLQQLPNTHGHIQGKAVRLLFDASRLPVTEVATAMSLALSRASAPDQAAAWLQGFLEHSGMILIHDARLLGTIDEWVGSIGDENFDAILPLLRRTFSTFPAPERRQIGAQLASGKAKAISPDQAAVTAQIDPARAARVIPVLKLIFGAKP